MSAFNRLLVKFHSSIILLVLDSIKRRKLQMTPKAKMKNKRNNNKRSIKRPKKGKHSPIAMKIKTKLLHLKV